MYKGAHKWEDAIRVADLNLQSEAAALRSEYYRWLLDTKQEEKAGAVKV